MAAEAPSLPDCIFLLDDSKESINTTTSVVKGAWGIPLLLLFSVLDPLYSVQLIENSGGISAMMVIQFSKETHFRLQRRRPGRKEGKTLLREEKQEEGPK